MSRDPLTPEALIRMEHKLSDALDPRVPPTDRANALYDLQGQLVHYSSALLQIARQHLIEKGHLPPGQELPPQGDHP